MKLSELIKLKNSLDLINVEPVKSQLEVLDGHLSANMSIPMHEKFKDFLDNSLASIMDIEKQIDGLCEFTKQTSADIQNEIDEYTKNMRKLGYMINGFYGSNLAHYSVEQQDRQMTVSDSERSEIVNVIRSYSSWEYPALEVGPGEGEWTECLIGSDPLYLVDRHQELLDITLSKFNETYQRRVRSYLTGLHAQRPEFDYSMLPKEQFGFIFAWNVINFWPYDETFHSLKQFFELLRPGGAMMFSFNNCEVVQCAEYAETGYKSYMTPAMLRQMFTEIGFELIQFRTTSQLVHWVEIKKPGQLSTTKRHQALGRICSINA